MQRLKKVRKMTWVLWTWCVIVLVWAISAGSTGAHDTKSECVNQAHPLFRSCSDQANTVSGAAVLIVLFIGFVGFIFFSIIWFMSRPKARV